MHFSNLMNYTHRFWFVGDMKVKRFYLLLIFIPLIACSQQKVENNSYEMMLKTLLSHSVDEILVDSLANDTTSYIFLDAREKEEYDVSHMKDAIWVGYDDFKLQRVENIDKSKPIVVYCSVGYRSEKISEKLVANGFSNVQNLYGGLFEWKNQNHTIVNSSNTPTDSIHIYSPSWGIWLNEGIKVH